jgi:hypothetical protein
MHTQGPFLIAAEGKRAVHKIPSSPASSTRESGKGGRLGGETLPFAAGCLNSQTADKDAFYSRSGCKCRNCTHAQHRNFGDAAIFTRPAVQWASRKSNPNRLFLRSVPTIETPKWHHFAVSSAEFVLVRRLSFSTSSPSTYAVSRK